MLANNIRTYKKGFTLMEILIVISIIAILVAIILPTINSSRAKSADAKKISDLLAIKTGLDNYYDYNKTYPNSTQGLSFLTSGCGGVSCFSGSTGISLSSSMYKYVPLVSAVSPYVLCSSGTCTFYHLGIALSTADQNATNDANFDSHSVSGGFYGASSDCGGSASTPDKCYDLTP